MIAVGLAVAGAGAVLIWLAVSGEELGAVLRDLVGGERQ